MPPAIAKGIVFRKPNRPNAHHVKRTNNAFIMCDQGEIDFIRIAQVRTPPQHCLNTRALDEHDTSPTTVHFQKTILCLGSSAARQGAKYILMGFAHSSTCRLAPGGELRDAAEIDATLWINHTDNGF